MAPRPEKAITGLLVQAAVIIAVSLLFYMALSSIDRSGPKDTEGNGPITRILNKARKSFNIKSPYLSEEDIRDKARRYIK